jgi:hypothetical protein
VIVLCDMDHTLSDAAWRDHLIPDWEAYYQDAAADRPIWPVIKMVNALAESGHSVVVLTARGEKWRKLTQNWLIRHDVRVDDVVMRPEGNYQSSPDLKIFLAREKFGVGDRICGVELVIDDRADVCAAFRALGVPTLQTTYARGGKS